MLQVVFVYRTLHKLSGKESLHMLKEPLAYTKLYLLALLVSYAKKLCYI